MNKQLESLKSGKFGKAMLSQEMLNKVRGGLGYGTKYRNGEGQEIGTDVNNFNMCDGAYDRQTTYDNGKVGLLRKSDLLWPGTIDRDYYN